MLSCRLAESVLTFLLLSAFLDFLLIHDLFDVLLRPKPNRFAFGEVVETWWQMDLAYAVDCLWLCVLLPDSILLVEACCEVMGFGLLVAWPLW